MVLNYTIYMGIFSELLLDKLRAARYGLSVSTFPNQTRPIGSEGLRGATLPAFRTPESMGPSRMPGPRFLIRTPEMEAARGMGGTLGTSSSRVYLQPRCGINCSCGGMPPVMERPIDLSIDTTRNEQEPSTETLPLYGLLRLTREMSNEEEIGEAETAGEDAEEHVDVVNGGVDRI